jgi:hypothetical protein
MDGRRSNDVSDRSPGEEELADDGKVQCGDFDLIEASSDTQEHIGDHRGDDLQAAPISDTGA